MFLSKVDRNSLTWGGILISSWTLSIWPSFRDGESKCWYHENITRAAWTCMMFAPHTDLPCRFSNWDKGQPHLGRHHVFVLDAEHLAQLQGGSPHAAQRVGQALCVPRAQEGAALLLPLLGAAEELQALEPMSNPVLGADVT